MHLIISESKWHNKRKSIEIRFENARRHTQYNTSKWRDDKTHHVPLYTQTNTVVPKQLSHNEFRFNMRLFMFDCTIYMIRNVQLLHRVEILLFGVICCFWLHLSVTISILLFNYDTVTISPFRWSEFYFVLWRCILMNALMNTIKNDVFLTQAPQFINWQMNEWPTTNETFGPLLITFWTTSIKLFTESIKNGIYLFFPSSFWVWGA